MSKRQTIRKAIIIFMFFLFPITISWLSPAMPVLYAAFAGVVTGAVIVFLMQFFISLFFGRVFCGYVCSAAGLQECMMRVSDKRIKNAKINIIKYFIWVPWILSIIAMFILYGGIEEVDFFAGTVGNWIFLTEPYRYAIFFGVIFLVAALHLLVGRRAFCHCVCWMAPFMIIGMKVSDLLRLPRLRLKSDAGSCIRCNQCTKKCPMSLDVKLMVETAKMTNSECVLCGECVDICPKKSIAYTFTNRKT